MSMPHVIHYPGAEDLAKVLACTLAEHLSCRVKHLGRALLVLPGGTSPQLLIKKLAGIELPWEKITVTTTDERAVPVSHADSNIGQVRRLLGDTQARYLSLQDDGGEMKSVLGPDSVMVIGMGADGHIASLFPGMRVTGGDEILCNVESSKPPKERISLRMESLLMPEAINLLVIGAEKRALCEEVLEGKQPDLPLAGLIKKAGNRLILHVA